MPTAVITRAQLDLWISPPRLATYSSRTIEARLAEEYQWSVRLGAAYMELICHVEVLLRNVVHSALQAKAGPGAAWFDDDTVVKLNGPARKSIRKSRSRIHTLGQRETPDRIVAGLTFDFWRYLFTKSHQVDVWTTVRHSLRGLPGSRRRTNQFAEFEAAVVAVYDLRNRVAHHEPIRLNEALSNLEAILLLAEYIDPAAHVWISNASQIEQVLAERPGHPRRPRALEQHCRQRRRRAATMRVYVKRIPS